MIELSPLRKNKIALSDYNYRRDIENRLLMAHFSTLDLEVLEEILYSSLTIPIRKLAKSIEANETEIRSILEKFSNTGLLTIDQDTVTVDKEMRKYYESQILKFDEDFTPGMEFLQGLLRKVPIHVLPTWYAIPRSSNNIFDSLIEKYLLTPQIFHRYLMELNLGDALLAGIIKEVYHSPELKIASTELIEKYDLTREQFEEYMLYLEFNFVCCLGYKKIGEMWKEVVTPFHEWREYLHFLRDTEPRPIAHPEEIVRQRPHDYAFVHDLSTILTMAKKHPFALTATSDGNHIPQKTVFSSIVNVCEGLNESGGSIENYIKHLISKLRMVKLADIVDGRLYALEAANDWLDMNLENRALYIYRHPLNRILSNTSASYLHTERNIREAEKSIIRILNSGWVYFDDFLKGVHVVLGEGSTVMLKRCGKTWKYTLPEYNEDEKALIKATIFEWLYEFGMVAVGTHNGKECFCVTPLGQSIFGR
ncbi:MAG TPA: hypothetical protein VLG49_03805 [Rhabdochlamydiaceae bacterium]|nr:hypothetical protein [Rhabdochlamydiaceae bacterium]